MPSTKAKPRFNPRGGDRRGLRPVTQRPSSSLWYGLAFVLLLFLVQMYYLTPNRRDVPCSEFKTLLKNGEIAEVAISDQVIHGKLKQASGGDAKQAKQFTTTRVEDPKLTEELEAR